MSDWTIRSAAPEDEACIASMWLAQICASMDSGYRGAHVKGSPEQIACWQEHQPIVTGLIRGAEVRVLCDPDRSTHKPGQPAVIWAWAVLDVSAIYGVAIKREFLPADDSPTALLAPRAELGREMTAALLGKELAQPMWTMFRLRDLARLKMIPDNWNWDRGWIAPLRAMSRAVVANDDPVALRVMRHVLDAPPWVPNERRAA